MHKGQESQGYLPLMRQELIVVGIKRNLRVKLQRVLSRRGIHYWTVKDIACKYSWKIFGGKRQLAGAQ
jgi:hypothetical protein